MACKTALKQFPVSKLTPLNPTVMRIEDLSWGPKSAPAILKNISFNVQHKKILGIVGANGAGKSSLLRCLYRVGVPTQGCIYLGTEDIWQIPPRNFAQNVAVVLQESPAEFSLSARQIIEMGRTPYYTLFSSQSQQDSIIIEQVISRLSLEGFVDRDFSKLSGGEKQKVYLARALVQQPEILILDEPTNHLDIRHQLEIMQLITELGITVIVTLHDLNIAATFCDQILLLHRGEILAHDQVDRVLTADLIKQAYAVDCHIGTHAVHHSRQFQFSLLQQNLTQMQSTDTACTSANAAANHWRNL